MVLPVSLPGAAPVGALMEGSPLTIAQRLREDGVRHEASLHHDATPASPMDVRKLCDHIINLHSLKAQ